ncbi:MAG TPA: hypothetical protein VG889_21045 [Rhizomicrobium sp.]|nr:hypothetical protein [Rhizomicrobium sp.]
MHKTTIIAAVLAMAASTAFADSMAPARVSFCGTVAQLKEAGCIGVLPSFPQTPIYEITSADPKPPLGKMISGSGVTGGASICLQGTHLSDVKWERAEFCPVKK